MIVWLLSKEEGLGDPWDLNDDAYDGEPVDVYPDREAAATVVGPIDGWSGPIPRKWRRVPGSLGAWQTWTADEGPVPRTWTRWVIAAQEIEATYRWAPLDHGGEDQAIVMVETVDANPVPPGIEAWLVMARADEAGSATDPLVAAQAGDVEAMRLAVLHHGRSLAAADGDDDLVAQVDVELWHLDLEAEPDV